MKYSNTYFGPYLCHFRVHCWRVVPHVWVWDDRHGVIRHLLNRKNVLPVLKIKRLVWSPNERHQIIKSDLKNVII
jgi:hypothetical protein